MKTETYTYAQPLALAISLMLIHGFTPASVQAQQPPPSPISQLYAAA